jgi:sporulation protein YlmC with PRC-barrel domain
MPHHDRSNSLASIDDLKKFRVAKGDPDPRGWSVVVGDGTKVGKVHDLLVDASARKVVYLDCAIDGKALDLNDRDRHILVPVDRVGLNRDDKQVIVASITAADVRRMPPFTGLSIAGDYEDSIRGVYERDRTAEPARDTVADRAAAADAADDAADRAAERRAAESTRPAAAEPVVDERVVDEREVKEELVVRRRVENDDERSS